VTDFHVINLFSLMLLLVLIRLHYITQGGPSRKLQPILWSLTSYMWSDHILFYGLQEPLRGLGIYSYIGLYTGT